MKRILAWFARLHVAKAERACPLTAATPHLVLLTPLIVIGTLVLSGFAQAFAGTSAAPVVFWASDPVRPDDTVLATGADMQRVAAVAIDRLDDRFGRTAPLPTVRVAPLQASPVSVKFLLPPTIKPGAYVCRLLTPGGTSLPFRLNLPDIWWLQADNAAAASPGGWVRVFGKALSFGGECVARLAQSGVASRLLRCPRSDGYSLRFDLPSNLAEGAYTLSVHNEYGGDSGWVRAGIVNVKAPHAWPTQVFNVMDFYGADADKEIGRTLDKGSPAPDRTDAIHAALAKAKANGGGIVYFPEGKYAIRGELQVPPGTLLRGAGMGRVALWWGQAGFALDGGSDARRIESQDADIPGQLISGTGFGIEEMSLFMPRMVATGIDAGDDFRMQRVRIRVDRYWVRSGQREDGIAVRLGKNGQVTGCDIVARGVAFSFTSGENERIVHNRIMAGKSHFALERADGVIVEDNDLISLDPTAYINLSGEGRNVYYARNHHSSFFDQQSDFSWTFDGTGMAYLGKLASVEGTRVLLERDPTYPSWAGETHPLWRRSAVCILDGRGAGQYRLVTANHGREWSIDRPFDVAPDATSRVAIIPFRGRVLVVDNHFEDAGWVNMGYGSSFDVVCSHNSLFRVGALLNLGLRNEDGVHASWYIQYLDNDVFEGKTLVQTTADVRAPQLYSGPTTRAAIHRRCHIHADNAGSIDIGGNVTDAIVEHAILDNPRSRITVGKETSGVLLRMNRLAGASGGDGGR